MKRGDLVTVATLGSYGKPRPAVILQSDELSATEVDSVTVCLVTSDLRNRAVFRILLLPTSVNGLRKASQIMTDKILAVPLEKVREPFGRLNRETLEELDRALTLVVGLAS